MMMAAVLMSGCGEKKPDVQKSESVVVWNYYNGPQKEAFDELVQQFNETTGKEKHIVVEAFSKGTIGSLIQAVEDSADGNIGSEKLPQLCSAYADTALELDRKHLLADIGSYMTKEEKEVYVDAYLEEGKFSDDSSVKILPVAKSTEVLTLNMTAWEVFAKETGAELSGLSTWEGIAETAEEYYRWTDAKTPEPEDGKAFFGRDAVANYMAAGSSQLGHEFLKVENGKLKLDFDRETAKKLWDLYYLPYIKGYYMEEGEFRSEDLKTGALIAYVGSTSGALYTPDKIIYEDGSTQKIECQVLPVPDFEGTEPVAVQQGSGMVLLNGKEATNKAAVEFLKWLTDKEINLRFCVKSGYLPVRKDANDPQFLEEMLRDTDMKIEDIVKQNMVTGMEEVSSHTLYVRKPFPSGNDARMVLSDTITEYAKTDRSEIKKMTEQGDSLSEAVEKLQPDQRFSEWYRETYEKLKGFSE